MTNAALPVNTLKLRESVQVDRRAVIPRGTPRERLLQSDFWAAAGRDLIPYDVIHCVDEGREYYATLLCLEAGHGYVNLIELSFVPLPALIVAQGDLPSNHELYYAGIEKGYCARRVSDGIIIVEGFANRQDCLEALLSHASLR